MEENGSENGGSIRVKWPVITLIVYLVAQMTVFIWESSDKNRRLITLETKVDHHVTYVSDARMAIIETELKDIKLDIEKLQRMLDQHDRTERTRRSTAGRD